MTRATTSLTRLQRNAVALAALAACIATATAADAAAPVEATVSLGLGGTWGDAADRAWFGQYNGLRTRSVQGLLGVDYWRRLDESDSQITFQGVRLLGDTREMDLVWRRQGDWRLTAHFGQIVRAEPLTVNTGMTGLGSTMPQIAALAGSGTGDDHVLKIKRTALGVGLSKWINRDFQIQFDIKTEQKEGARIFGVGVSCPSPATPGCAGGTGIATGAAIIMLPEPIDSRHSQVEARLSYAHGGLRLSAGYYGSFYDNRYGSINPTIPGSLNNATGDLLPLSGGLQALLARPVALPPDSQAHQFDLSGGYDFTRTTRANFKLAYTQAKQHADFAAAGLAGAPAGVANLGGEVNTTLAQVGISSRPIPQLSLVGNIRYEDKNDRTPLALYDTVGASPTTNQRLPSKKLRAKVEAAYRFNSETRGTLGADYESIDRGVFTATSAVAGLDALRQKTDETGVHLDLRHTFSETMAGSVGLASSQRRGSNWLKPNALAGVTEVADPADPATGFFSTALFMPTLADRERNKARLFADWAPTETLALQLNIEAGQDRYTAPTSYGLQRTRMEQAGIDVSYALTDNWSLTGNLSYASQVLHQARPAGYVLSFDNRSTSVGLGATGKVSSKIQVGGNLTFIDDKSVYAQALDSLAGADSAALLAATGGLPDILYRQTALNLFAKYTIDKQSSVRLDVLAQRTRFNDWAWGLDGQPFVYADGTTLWRNPIQNAGFIGLTYVYQWR